MKYPRYMGKRQAPGGSPRQMPEVQKSLEGLFSPLRNRKPLMPLRQEGDVHRMSGRKALKGNHRKHKHLGSKTRKTSREEETKEELVVSEGPSRKQHPLSTPQRTQTRKQSL